MMSASRARQGLNDLPGDGLYAYQVLDAATGSRSATQAWLASPLEPYLPASGSPRVQLASVLAIQGAGVVPLPRVPALPGLPSVRPLGPAGVAAGAALLEPRLVKWDNDRERYDVEKIIASRHLDVTSQKDISSARAYLWAQIRLPYNWRYFYRSPSGPIEINKVAEAMLRYERDNPGTVDLARIYNSEKAWRAIDQVVKDALAGVPPPILEPLERRSTVDAALSANSTRARAAARISPGNQSWQAHHLIPFAVVKDLPNSVQKVFVVSGWKMDSPENVIPLPANMATYLSPLNTPIRPYQDGSHPIYDGIVRAALSGLVANAQRIQLPEVRKQLSTIENHFRIELVRNITQYHPKLR